MIREGLSEGAILEQRLTMTKSRDGAGKWSPREIFGRSQRSAVVKSTRSNANVPGIKYLPDHLLAELNTFTQIFWASVPLL